jgi:multidrug efflux pump subunit AcrB
VRAAGLLGVSFLLIQLSQVGCHKAEPAPEVPPVESERFEVRVVAPGMDSAQIEAQVVQPIEAALLSTPSLRHVTSEAAEAHARLWLEFPADQRDAVLTAVRARLDELAPMLPPELEPPVLRRVNAPDSTFVRWAIESDTIDASAMGRLHEELVVRIEQLDGVFDVQSCAPRSRVVVELEPERLRAYGIEPGEVEAALRRGLADSPMGKPEMLDIEGLRRTVISTHPESGTAVALGELAAIRYGVREPTCLAAGAAGLAAAGSVRVRDRSTANMVEQVLDELAGRFPPGTRLLRFGAADTTIELSVAADRELAEVAESIGSGLVRLAQPWLVEVGIATEPCVAVGTRVRLSIGGSEPVSLASFESIPGVSHVQLLDAPNQRRLWLLGPDSDDLQDIAERERSRLRALPGLRSVDAYIDVPRAELRIEADRTALAERGITTAEFAQQVMLLRGELEVAELRDADGTRVPVMLRVGASEDIEPAQLGAMLVHAGSSSAPPERLDAIASIREATSPARICRRDGQRAVMFVLEVADQSAWASLAPWAAAEPMPGHRWSWAD